MTLVVGATGLLGRRLCERLRDRGEPVRALVRTGSSPARVPAGIGSITGDLRNPHSLVDACRGARVVITTANTMSRRRPGDTLAGVDRDGALALVAVAASAGVERFVYTSASPVLPPDNPFIRYKREVEAAVRASGMAWTILQPSAFMEVHAGPVAGWDFARGRARLMGSGRAPVSYISVDDVAAFAVAAAFSPAGRNRDLRLAGPEPLTPLDAVAIAERVTRRRFQVLRLPGPILRVLSMVARPFNESFSSLCRMGLALDLGDVLDMIPLQQEFGVSQTTFDVYARRMAANAVQGRPRGAGQA